MEEERSASDKSDVTSIDHLPVEACEEPDDSEPRLFVGIGASAGGLEAIESFFAKMPAENDMAFVVIQHLSPDYKSLMVELLSKRTQMAVRRAEEGMKVEVNTVYLIPPKRNLTIFHGKLLLSDQDHSKGINLPIDLFFQSLAEDQGEKAVGIVLSGTGSDGMRGIRYIKEAGGMIMVQTEGSAKFDGMPRSALSTGLADFVLPPEEMPGQLRSLVEHPYLSRKERPGAILSDEDGLVRIFAMLRERSKVDFTFYKPSTIVRRLERRMTVNQVSNLRDYARLLENYPREVSTLFRELLIGVTSFFRDPKAYQVLSENCIPEILKRPSDREIRFWVSGCSTGEEAYSIAMLCSDFMEKANKATPIKIFATDVDQDALARASAGVYPSSIVADLPPRYLAKYFDSKGQDVQVSRKLREMVVFARQDIIKDPPFTNIDLISCRNLLIYLQPVLQKKVLEFFNFSLNPGGVLFLGTSETTGEMSTFFEVLDHKWKIYRSKGERHPTGVAGATVARYGGPPSLRKAPISVRPFSIQEEERLLERLLQSLAGDYLPTMVVINEGLELLHSIGDTSLYFQLPSGRMQNDITRMIAKDLAIPLATGIQRAFAKKEEVKYSNVKMSNKHKVTTVQMRIKPLAQKKGQDPLLAVFFENLQDREATFHATETADYDIGKEVEQRIADLEQELQFTKENLQATIEELETSNEELQATNEELLASNEELQSTNEELQSVNEELHTVNAEHQLKIMELTDLTNDLDNLFSCTDIAILFLDENLDIRKFTPAVTRIFHIIPSDIGRPLSDLSHQLKDFDPIVPVRRVQRQSTPVEEEVATLNGLWYLMRILPYDIGRKTFSGIIMIFTEITPVRATQDALLLREQQLEELMSLTRVGYWEYKPQKDELTWSREIYEIHELETTETVRLERALGFVLSTNRPVLEQAFQESCNHGASFDEVLQIVTARGNSRWIRIIGTPKSLNGSVVRVTGALQDITQLTDTQKDLVASERRYRELFDNMSSGVLVLQVVEGGTDFILVDMNKSSVDISRVNDSEALGRSIREVFPDVMQNGLMEILQRVAATDQPVRFPVLRYKDEQRDQWIEHSVYRLSPQHLVIIYDDVTDRITREQSKGVQA